MFNKVITTEAQNSRVSVSTGRLRDFLRLCLDEAAGYLRISMHWYRAQKQHTNLHVTIKYNS
jgi:hypothetical protein